MTGAQGYVPAKWVALMAATEKLAGAETFDEVTEIVRDTARGVSGAEGITFVRLIDNRCHYIAEDATGPLWEGQNFPGDQCVSGWAMTHGEVTIIPDIFDDARVPVAAYRETFVRSMVMTPVGSKPACAAIGAYWSEVGRPNDETLALLTLLARHVEMAMRNIALRTELDKAQQQLSQYRIAS